MEQTYIPGTFHTKSGMVVINMMYVPLNSQGNKVTFPLKGSWYDPSKLRKRMHYAIWMLNGAHGLLQEDPLDLKDPPEVL